jgi:hypothetical protein
MSLLFPSSSLFIVGQPRSAAAGCPAWANAPRTGLQAVSVCILKEKRPETVTGGD